jgi:hypothetical protein
VGNLHIDIDIVNGGYKLTNIREPYFAGTNCTKVEFWFVKICKKYGSVDVHCKVPEWLIHPRMRILGHLHAW